MENHAVLPEEYVEQQIKDMSLGTSGYTVPWGMFVDEGGKVWLKGNYTIKAQPAGTAQMLVERREDGEYAVDLGYCRNHRWSPGGSYSGNFESLPVRELRETP